LCNLLHTKTAYPGQADQVTLPLPDVHFPLHFRHYSGYLDATNGTRLHYWFFESTSPTSDRDPVTLWLNGGPGQSSLIGAFSEIGPILLALNGTMVKNPHAWSSVSNLLFLESPVGVGFSYSSSNSSYQVCSLPCYYGQSTLLVSDSAIRHL